MDSGVNEPLITPHKRLASGARDANAMFGKDAAMVAESALIPKTIVAKDGVVLSGFSANIESAITRPRTRPTKM